MASLTNQKISNSYLGLLNTTSNGVLTSSLAQITDGNGNGSPIYLSTAALNLYNKYTFPDAVPASGTFLKATDGSGTLAWVAESGGDVKKTGTITINTIAVWNDATETLRSEPAMTINPNGTISLTQPNSSGTSTGSFNIGGGNIATVSGSNNTGFGNSNLVNVTSGGNNVAIGSFSLNDTTTGSNNTAVGTNALADHTEGDGNVAVGAEALADVRVGGNNTAVGRNAGANIDGTSGNTVIGKNAGFSLDGTGTQATSNTFIGVDSGTSVTSGSKNVILGSNSGGTIATSSNNIIISDGDGNARIQVNSAGSVGIGDSPSAKLSVVDSASGAAIKIGGAVTDTSAAYYGFMHDGTDLQGATQVNMFYSGGAIKASTTIAEFASFRIDAPSLSASGSAITNSYGIYQASTAQKNYFAGNVGIGTDSITDPLTVNGLIRVGTSTAHTKIATDGLFINGTTGVNHGYISSSGDLIFYTDNQGSNKMVIDGSGNVTIAGSISKGSGSFKIDHPIVSKKDTHYLVHSFIESPQANNIYRGKIDLINGLAQINLDEVSEMTEGTFILLNTNIHCYTTNESDWDAVKGKVDGNILKIECQNSNSIASISWLVIGERQDKHIKETNWTDANGKVIVEPIKIDT